MDIFDIALVAVVIPSLLYVLAAWAMGPERTAEPLHQRLDRHRKLERLWPFYVFMLRLGMLVWVGFLIWSVWSVVRSFLLSGNLDIEFGESEIAQAILFVLAAGYLALSLWRARRPFSSVAAATFRANKAVPVMPGTLPATRHALTDMMLLSTLRDTPTLWYTDADTVDALVVADGVQARIIITDGFTKVLDPLEQ
ncbi:MAG: hypothetical protein U1E22_00550, partial [Coriobacteriia bacterium]|nr:hypothetical protein [Coriobacteriia bacterium]